MGMKPVLAVVCLASSVIGCTRGNEARVGHVQATISTVPAGVGCVEIVAQSSRTITVDVDVQAGQTVVVPIENVPAGNVTFSAQAFAPGCAARAAAIASWASLATVAMVQPGQLTSVSLLLVPVGDVGVGVGFGDGGAETDMSAGVPPDMSAGAPPDMSGAVVDMASSRDLTPPRDLTPLPPDLTPSVDMMQCPPPAVPGNECNLFPQCGCPAGFTCDLTSANVTPIGSTDCYANGTAKLWSPCNSTSNRCAAGMTCTGGTCAPFCNTDANCSALNASCWAILDPHNTSNAIPGAGACRLRCDPANPQGGTSPFSPCPAQTDCSFSSRDFTSCTGPVGTGKQGASCLSLTGTGDCAPGYHCDSPLSGCAKRCHVGSTNECDSGYTCTSYSPKAYALGVEIGSCH